MIVLGVDPGTRVMGYAFLETGTRLKVLEYGVLRTPAKATLMERLGLLVNDLAPLIREYRPDLLAMETAFYSKYARPALVLGHARGAIMALAHQHQMDFAEFSPKEIKQASVGSGAASKEQVSWMMMQHLNLRERPTPLDASDALAVAWTWICRENT